MRGAVDAALAALRTCLRASQAAWRRLAALGRSALGAAAVPGAQEFTGDPARSRARRNLITIGAGSIVAVAGFVAALVSVLDGGTQPGQPRTVIEPYGAVQATTSSAASGSGATTGPAPIGVRSAGSTAGKPTASGGAAEPTGSASAVGQPAVTASATSADTATATPSSGLVDLCRSVVAAGNSWPSVLKGSDRTTVIAAAGSRANVLPYCTNLLSGTPTQ